MTAAPNPPGRATVGASQPPNSAFDPPYTQPHPYFGQWGEDRWLVEHLAVPAQGVFVDIGAGDGVRGSNTLYFERRGWTGLSVDPDPRNHAPLARRQCVVRHCAISNTAGKQTFSQYDAKPSWSGLGDRGQGYTVGTAPCLRLGDLLHDLGIERIDLLNIDVEGTELDVWSSFDPAEHRPGIVIIEYDSRDPDRSEERIIRALGADRFELIHRTPANLVLRGLDPVSQRRWRHAR
ncbi:FkbM family methyltransferase [Micromonospora humi]|uniref:Methyltransferase, FkbM family n=1 Tax=Micromonospora humi TaxID=745366 RepID=A0A1C5IQC2_9ACTN|nr:FkbM family methyltransferase [Micromonospora humi]SCG60512.1 methyltransferase, FkbM family [Micromonospora humi]